MFTVRHSISLGFTSPRQRQVNGHFVSRCDPARVEKRHPAAHTELVTSATKKILEDALALPEKERKALVEALSDSLDPEAVELSPEWTREIRNRIAQLESGEAKTIPWNEVADRIRNT